MILHHRYDSDSKKVQAFWMIRDKGESKRRVFVQADAEITLKIHGPRCDGKLAVVGGLPAGIRWGVCTKCGAQVT